MTTDPERLLSQQGDATDLERDLLESVRDVAPKGEAKALAWTGIAARIAAVSVIGTGAASSTSAAAASGSAAAATATKAGGTVLAAPGLLTKVVLAVAVTGGAVGGGYWVQHNVTTDEVPASAPAAVVAPKTPTSPHDMTARPTEAPPREIPDQQEPAAPGIAASDPVPARPKPAAKRAAGTPAEMLEAESQLLTEARAKLRSGDTEGASLTLERLRTEFPAGVLVQEREVLAIEVLARRGDTALARQRAERFIQAHPKSPHSEALKRLLAKP